MNENRSIDKHELVNAISKYKYWFLSSILIFTLGAFIFQMFRTPVYTVSTIFQLDSVVQKKATLTNAKHSQENFQTYDNTSAEITKLLKSASMIKKAGADSDANFSTAEYGNDLLISPGKDSNTLVLSLNTAKPQQAKYFLEKLLTLTNKEHYRTTIIKSFNDSLTLLSTAIAAKNKQVTHLKTENKQIAGGNNTVIDAEDQKQRDILKTITPYLKNADRQYQLIPTSFPVKDPYINNLILQFNDAQADKQHQLSENPDKALIAAANNKIIALQRELQNAVDSAETSSDKTQLSTAIGSDKVQLTDSLSKTKQLINNDISSYARLLQKKQRYEQLNTTRNIGPHYVNIFQVNEAGFSAIAFYLSAFLCGLLLPLGVIYLFYRDKVNSAIRINNETPVLGNISSPEYSGLQVITAKIPGLLTGQRKILLVSSLRDVGGKNTICGKLALHFSAIGAKVVIVDLNFSDDKTNDSPAPVYKGVKDFILGRSINLDDIIIPTQYTGVSMIPKGTTDLTSRDSFDEQHLMPESVDEDQKDLILTSPKLRLMIENLSQKFDYVLLNSASLNTPADVLPLTEFSTINVIILEGSTNIKTQIETLQRLVVKYSIKGTYAIINS